MQTLDDLFRAMFPPALSGDAEGEQWQIPLLPADIFAFCASALDRASAFNHIVPVGGTRRQPPRAGFIVDDRLRSVSREIGGRWRLASVAQGSYLPPIPSAVHCLWSRLAAQRSSRLHTPGIIDIPEWWRICLQLVLIADEASWDMGFKNNNPFWRLASDSFVSSQKQWQNQPLSFLRPIYSISSASPEMACVLPKSRTSTVGCSVRSISHNLALLPPRGNVNARWFLTPHYELEGPSDSTVGLLLIPFPYWIDEHAFKQSNRTSAAATPGWGWFDVEQTWLPDCKTRREQFVDFVESLVKDAQTHGPVSGVVLPELALNFSLFEDITDRLKSISGIDFFISGTSQDWTNQHGNFVSIFPFYQLTDSERNEPIGNLSDLIICRSKHHRWKLDRSQINQYKLNLNEQDDWWECIDLHERILDFFPYRNGSTISTLICEDLARIDPCQAAARAIGPNLLIALLMDGPQLSQRWPGRHATGLTEDPGSSVLTFTSLGLIERQNAQKNAKTDREHPLSYSFALWKDKHNGAKSLDLPRGAEALYLSVTLEHRTEHTLDGRCDKSATCQYRLKHTVPIRSSIKPDWVE